MRVIQSKYKSIKLSISILYIGIGCLLLTTFLIANDDIELNNKQIIPTNLIAASDEIELDNQFNGQRRSNSIDVNKSPLRTSDNLSSTANEQITKKTTVIPLEQIDQNEIVRRREKELEAENLYTQGRKSFIGGDYEAAVKSFIAAQIKLNECSRSEDRILQKQKLIDQLLEYTYEEWGEQIATEAQLLIDLEKYEEAIDKFQKVVEKNPAKKKEIDKKIQQLQRSIKFAEFKEKTSPKYVDPEKPIRDNEIDTKLEQGRVYFTNKRYSDAREMFEHVLLKDPYNVEATRYLKRMNEKLLEAGTERRDVMTTERIAEIKWKWNDPVTPLVSPDVVIESSQPVKKISKLGEGIWAKLETIVIPKISFEEASIHAVIKYLKSRSRELDPDGEGVNIFLQLSNTTNEVSVADSEVEHESDELTLDDFDQEFIINDQKPDLQNIPKPPGSEITITMDFDNIPLGEAIRYICQGAGLKYKVETHAIIIASQDVQFDEMETRFYPVEAGFLEQKATKKSTGGITGSSSDQKVESKEVLELFQTYGVEFPQGAKIIYDQRTSKLIVTNTPSNLRKVEKILAELNVQPLQVTIESKFVEISQNDLEELGFEWLFLGGDGSEGNKNIKISGDSEFTLLKQTAGNATDPRLSSGLRFLAPSSVGNDRLLSINSILGDFQFNTIIRAIEQKDSSDVLSAPKVTTISGQTAILKVIDTRKFPESYSEPEIQFSTETSGGGQTGSNIKPPTPQFGAETEIGVILTVTPTVSSDGYSIDLDLQPEVVQFLGFDNYDVVQTLEGQNVTTPIQIPVISKRKISTKVIVWDGETVVLGGMITENVQKVEDKIPFLGDLPVLGRLFKNESQKSEKRNLLIFVTARLVNPAGLPVRTADIRGLPDFRR